MLTAAYAHGQNAVIADKDSEESKELENALQESVKPYESYATGSITKLDGKANDYILDLAKEKLATKAMKRAVGISVANGEIPSAEVGKPTQIEK